MSDYTLSKACKVLATRCCVCGRELVDADSVDLGIGPVCRKKYMKSDATVEQFEAAFGLMATGGAPEHIIEACATRKTAREICNVLVYWFSANLDKPEITVALLPAVRALGYSRLADVLEKARVQVRLVEVDGWIEVYTPYHEGFVGAVRAIPGRRCEFIRVPGKKDKFKCWAIPAASEKKEMLWKALKRFYAGHFMHSKKGYNQIPGSEKPVAPVVAFPEEKDEVRAMRPVAQEEIAEVMEELAV